MGGLRPSLIDVIEDKDHAASWERFIGCMSDVSIENVMVDFAINMRVGPNVDFSVCPIPDPVEEGEENPSTTPGQLGKCL